ncbi:MAG: hypothetical protein P8M20_03240 [Planctomycetaceae bacterium]|nr:hypothetical protein [Planctomycetaceae bacterium]
MKHRQNLGRTAGYADVRIIVVTRRWVVPSGPDCAGCNEDCQGSNDGFNPPLLLPLKDGQWQITDNALYKQWAKAYTRSSGFDFYVQVTMARDKRMT